MNQAGPMGDRSLSSRSVSGSDSGITSGSRIACTAQQRERTDYYLCSYSSDLKKAYTERVQVVGLDLFGGYSTN